MIDKLVEEYSEDTNGNEMIHNVNLNDHKKVCNSCTIYMVLLIITFIKIKWIGSVYSFLTDIR